MPVCIKNKEKIFFIFLLGLLVSEISAQESGSLYYLPEVSQWSLENPAMQNHTDKLVVGMPFLSGVSWQWNSSVPINALFSKGFAYSFHRFYDTLDEQGKIQTSAGATVFFASFRHQNYTFSLSVSERAFSEGIFDREIVRIIRDGTNVFYGKNEYLGEASMFLTHYREIAPGVSKRLHKDLDVGVRAKLLFGKLHFSGEDMSFAVEPDQENLLIQTEGNFIFGGALRHQRDTIRKSSTFYADISPGNYFFQPRNLGVALDLGVVYRPNKFSELSLSFTDAGLLGFRHKTFESVFSRPVIYSEKDFYQSVDEGVTEPRYLEPRQALIKFGDSLAYVLDVNKTNSHNFSTLPLKIGLAGKYRFSEKLTAGFQNQFKTYQLNALNLFSLFATATLNPRFTFYGSLSLLNTENIFPGFGASYTNNWLQIYFTSNNISGIIQPMATKQLNLSFGINFLFETQ